jgi:hypothetical protein
MRAVVSLAAMALPLLLPAVSALPEVAARQTDESLNPWVSVDDEGTPVTVTPALSTVDGTPTVVSAAPVEVTGSVLTRSYYGSVVTTTSMPKSPTPTGSVAGSFPVCHNQDGDFAPWCAPTEGTTLNPGTTYYCT